MTQVNCKTSGIYERKKNDFKTLFLYIFIITDYQSINQSIDISIYMFIYMCV